MANQGQFQPAAQDRSTPQRRDRWGVFLSYAAHTSGDGLGAQAQRIMGIFGAAESLGFGYVHREIESIERNPGDPQTSASDRERYLRRANQIFQLPSGHPSRFVLKLGVKSLTEAKIRWLKILSSILKRCRLALLVEVTLPLPWSDLNPNCYAHAAAIMAPRISSSDKPSSFRVDVHIRRALAPVLGGNGLPYDRFVPTTWYEEVVRLVVETLTARDVKPHIRIHTDLPTKPWRVPSDTSVGTRQMWEFHGLINKQGYLIDLHEDLAQVFSIYAPVEVAQEWDPLDALQSMVEANLLITYASSLSYVAGLLRGNRPTVSPKFFHNCPSNWLVPPREMSPEIGAQFAKDLEANLRGAERK